MHNPNDIYSVPSKDRFKDEDPTESSRSERTVEIASFRSQRMVDLPFASPDENDRKEKDKEDTPIPIDSLPRRRRCAFLAIVAVVVGALAAGSIVLVWFLQTKDSQKEAVSPNQQGHASWVPSDPKPVGCTRDSFQCPDGSFVGRDIANNCDFYPCPVYYPEHEDVVDTTTRCSSEVLICTDLSSVVRTGPNCEFADCPKGTCPVDTHTCKDGTLVGREPFRGCEFAPCPTSELPTAPQQQPSIPRPQQSQQIFTLSPNQPRPQQQETIPRPQQSQQVFTPPPQSDAATGFAEVPPQQESSPSSGSGFTEVCPREIKMCTDFTTVTRKGPNCEFEECPPGACRVESKVCPDGTSVGLDLDNNCEFKACPALAEGQCPEGINPREIKLCPNFTTVTRSRPNCEFALCP